MRCPLRTPSWGGTGYSSRHVTTRKISPWQVYALVCDILFVVVCNDKAHVCNKRSLVALTTHFLVTQLHTRCFALVERIVAAKCMFQ